MFLGCTRQAKRMKTIEYAARAPVMTPEMAFSSFVVMSVIAARGSPQLATCIHQDALAALVRLCSSGQALCYGKRRMRRVCTYRTLEDGRWSASE